MSTMTQPTATQPGSEQTTDKTALRPFRVDVPEAELTDLRRRIVATRLPERETVTDFSQGVPLATVEKLARYWATEYDWRKVEARINAVPNFITEIDGLDIHFIHVRSKHENALPVIVTHGWPGSIVEQLKLIEPLTNPTAHGGTRSGCLPRGHSVDAGLRLLGQTHHHRLGARAHRACLGRADEASRLHELCGAGRRLGCNHHRADGRAGTQGTAGRPHQHAQRDTACDRRRGACRRAGAGRTFRG